MLALLEDKYIKSEATIYVKENFMEKIEVKICLGTSCFVMGAAHLQELAEIAPQKYGDLVSVSGSPCLSLCTIDWEYSRAPYVKVADEVVYEATVEKVLEVIEKKLDNAKK